MFWDHSNRLLEIEKTIDITWSTIVIEAFIMDLFWGFNDKNNHDDVIKCKYFPRYWPFAKGIHRPPVDSPHKGQWRGALLFSLICALTNEWANNRDAGNLGRHRAHYDVTMLRLLQLFLGGMNEHIAPVYLIYKRKADYGEAILEKTYHIPTHGGRDGIVYSRQATLSNAFSGKIMSVFYWGLIEMCCLWSYERFENICLCTYSSYPILD